MSINVSGYIERMIRDGITPESIRRVQKEVCDEYDEGLFGEADWDENVDLCAIRHNDNWLRNPSIKADEATDTVQRMVRPSASRRQSLREFRNDLTFAEKIYAVSDEKDKYHSIAMIPIEEMEYAAKLDAEGASQG